MASGRIRFGVIADVQYADKENTHVVRAHRAALPALSAAVDVLNGEPNLDFVVNLGDLVDEAGIGAANFTRVLPVLNGIRVLLWNVAGNHDFHGIRRSEALRLLEIAQPQPAYRGFVRGAWRFVFLDSLELSLAACDSVEDSDACAEARRIPRALADAEDPAGQTWNGCPSPRQLLWLESELSVADAENQRAVIFSHLPCHPYAASPRHLCWNHSEIRNLLARHRSAVAFFAGHDHAGGCFSDDSSGTLCHHVTFRALCDHAEGGGAFAVVSLPESGSASPVRIHGFGAEPSRELALD